MHRANRKNLVKVWFYLEPDAWHGSATESLWGSVISDDQVRLENSPFYAFGVSFQDIVATRNEDERRVFDRVVTHSGHSTYRIIRTTEDEGEFARAWRPLEQLGCTYEAGPVLAVDVPPGANLQAAYKVLEAGEASRVWSFEEGHCGHPVETEAES